MWHSLLPLRDFAIIFITKPVKMWSILATFLLRLLCDPLAFGHLSGFPSFRKRLHPSLAGIIEKGNVKYSL